MASKGDYENGPEPCQYIYAMKTLPVEQEPLGEELPLLLPELQTYCCGETRIRNTPTFPCPSRYCDHRSTCVHGDQLAPNKVYRKFRPYGY